MRFSNPSLRQSFRCVFTALALLAAAVSGATEIHLSPAGNDANPGTAALPVATPQGAQVLVRSLIQAGLTDAVDVIFAAGTYAMDAPLELRPEDSGTAAFPITWKAAAGAEVVLSGGRPITSTWINGGGGVWVTDLTGIGLGSNQWNFRQLFVNGSRATRARFPNVTAPNPFLYATGGDFDYLTITPALVKSSWGTAADAQINVVPQSRFFNQWNTVTAVNTVTGRIDIADSERHRLINSGSWFWIEGVQAELDEPGEWFLNPVTGRLSYMPPVGVDPNTQTIIAPFLNRIVNVKGDVNAGTHVVYVHFDRLIFLHTNFTLGQIEARVHTDTAIMFENTNDSSVKNCFFENIGGYALWLHLDSQHNVFDRNTVQYSGGGGVLLTGSRFAYMDDSKIYTPGEAAAKVAPILNEITRNTVEHCGRIRYYGGGVHLDSRPFSMTMAPGNYIAHNLFNDLSRNGVFAFRNQGGNVVEYNHIHNAMQTTIDGAAIHFATMNTLNAPNFILNNWLYDIWGWTQQANGTPTRSLGNGVFLDWDTSNTTVKDNWIYNSVSGAVKVIFGGNQNVVQSGNQSSSTVITPPFVTEVGPDGTATNGIDLANNKLTGSIISYQDANYFSKTGTWTQETAVGIVNLFEFKFLTATAAAPSDATFTLPITEDGNYKISLLYYRGTDRASNVPIVIDHTDGIANVTWNMKQGSAHGFAVPVGTYRFVAAETNTVTLSTTGTDGKVIADSVAFVKIEDNDVPVASNVQITGSAVFGGTLTGSYTYSDANNDLEALSRYKYYRSDDAVFDAGDSAISGATTRNYTVQAADLGKSLFFEVTPVAFTGTTEGALARSGSGFPIAFNSPPTATQVAILAPTAQVGTPLSASYTYGDAEGDTEGASVLRWYRSDDAVLDAGDTVVAGAVEVTPVLVKTSTSFTAQRLASNLFNATGMSASAKELLNLNGSQAGEPTSADGISWVTSSGSESTLLADRKAWFVADLGASYPLSNLRIWNFQWALSGGDLSDRGISQFDCYVRDSAADTTDGTPGGTPINLDSPASAAAFALGSGSPWQAAFVNQTLARAPNTDTYTGQSFPLAGQTGRFLAVVADNYYGGNGIALGKVRVDAGQSTLNYTPVAADDGKYLIFQVTPVTTTGIPLGSAVASGGLLVGAPAQSGFIRKISQGIPQRVVLYGTSLTAAGAWVSHLQTAVEETYPGMVTWINSGGSGNASDWGLANLQTKVIDQNPDTVFIEFSMNDAASILNVSRAQALANLTSMVNGIKAANPNCEIILQIMNPVDRRETDTYSPRPDLALYQQDYRDFAASNGPQCIDHMPAFMALLDEGSPAYRVFVPDGVHPSADGFARYLTPALFHAIGLDAELLPVPSLVIDNTDPAPAIVFNGTWTSSTATAGFIGTDYRHNGNTEQGSKSAVFTPNIPSAGTYPVFLRWTSGSNRASNIPVTVNYNGGSQTVTINQRSNGGTWFRLGTFPFAAGTGGTVTIGTTDTNGFVMVDALGVGLNPPAPAIRLRMDNGRAAEPSSPSAAARASSLIVWRNGPTTAAVDVPLNFTGGSSTGGIDYAALPASITIPAGRTTAAVELLPLHDLLTEVDETFKVSLGSVAGYTMEYPNKSSIVIEDRAPGGANVAPVASGVTITGTAATSETLQGNYAYSDAEGDAESGTTLRWLRSNDVTLDGGDTPVGTSSSYQVQAADVGKTLFFEVTPGATTGTSPGSPIASAGTLVSSPPPGGFNTLIHENFGGGGASLNGKPADAFAAAVTTAGGSATWVAASSFLNNGVVNLATRQGAYLNLGNFINAAKGMAGGKFKLTMTIGPTTGNWISLGFAAETTPNLLKDFTNTGSGSAVTTGLGTIIYRAVSNPGELDMFGGGGSTTPVDGPDGNTGNRTLTVTLDLTTAGGYNGTSNFGTTIWSDSVLGPLGSYTYTTSRNFGSILITQTASSSGTISALTLSQVVTGGTAYANWIGGMSPATGFITDSDNDGLPNGVEHILGGNPNTYSARLTEVSSSPTSATFKHKLNPNIANDVTYGYQWSTDLVNWHASGGTNTGGTSATITPSAPDANQVVTVLIAITGGPATKLFGRLQARLVP